MNDLAQIAELEALAVRAGAVVRAVTKRYLLAPRGPRRDELARERSLVVAIHHQLSVRADRLRTCHELFDPSYPPRLSLAGLAYPMRTPFGGLVVSGESSVEAGQRLIEYRCENGWTYRTVQHVAFTYEHAHNHPEIAP